MAGRLDRTSLLSSALLAGATLTFAVASPSEQRSTGSTSVGQANDGALRGGMRLPDRGRGFVSRPSRNGYEAKWGTEELVGAVRRIGADVERRAPGASLFVGDLGMREGGPCPGHESHQAGRDVDLVFYSLDEAGEVAPPRGISYDGEGRGALPSGEVRLFDTRRNWLVLRSLVESDEAHLQRVLVSEPLRALLLAWAREHREPAWIVERAGEVMCDTWSPHDDHFHVRLFCTAEDIRSGCRDEHPLYPWRRTELAAEGILGPLAYEDPHRAGARARRWLDRRAPRRQWCP